jgi:hypothetical protein
LLAIITRHVVKGFLFHDTDIAAQAKTGVGPEIGRGADETDFAEVGGYCVVHGVGGACNSETNGV